MYVATLECVYTLQRMIQKISRVVEQSNNLGSSYVSKAKGSGGYARRKIFAVCSYIT